VFKSYNIRDVEVEISIQERLKKYPVPDSVWNEYRIDQMINDRGHDGGPAARGECDRHRCKDT
jgi:hypothetical protein